MIKKMIIGGVLIIIGFFLIVFQLSAIEASTEKDEMVKIYTLSKNLNYGEVLKEEDLSQIYIRKEDIKAQYLSKIDNIENYLVCDKTKNSILFKGDISIEKPLDKFLQDDKHNIITLSLGIEEANAWNFKEYDEVDLYFVSSSMDKENIIYEDIIIYKIINLDKTQDSYNNSSSPQYVSLLVDKEESYEILSNKSYGRFEIIIN